MKPLRNPSRYPFQLFGMSLFLAWEILVAPFEHAFGMSNASLEGVRAWGYPLLTVGLLMGVACYSRRPKTRSLWSRPVVALCGACALAVPLLDLAGLWVPAAAPALGLHTQGHRKRGLLLDVECAACRP